MTFLVDAQLPHSLALALTEAGHPSQAVRDINLRDAEDEAIREYAGSNGFCIITKDSDFADHALRTEAGPPIIWLRVGNCSNRELRDRLIPLLDEIVVRIESGDKLVEVW